MRWIFGFAAVLVAGSVAAAAEATAVPTVKMVGAINLPEKFAVDGTAIPLVGFSGITWLGDDSWAAILDNNNRLATFTVARDEDGRPLGVENLALTTLSVRHDYEDVAPCPPTLQERIARKLAKRGLPDPGRCLLVCDEETPAIRGVALADGAVLGSVPLPEIVKKCRPNKGLESLAVDPDGRRIWTANEEALIADGSASSLRSGTIVRLFAIATPDDAADGGGEPAAGNAQFAYEVDPPHEMIAASDAAPLSGVSAVVALGDGKLLVLERSGGFGAPPFENRIYLVDTSRAEDVSAVEALGTKRPAAVIPKRLIWREALGCNVEGLALGPPVGKQGRTMVAIADNGHIGGPTKLFFLVLE